MYPSLTTVDNCLDQQIRAALDMLTNPAPPPSSYAVVMQPTLIARQSSGPPPFSLIR
jgi:DNA-binding LacI/PurR family transcriptional regulator